MLNRKRIQDIQEYWNQLGWEYHANDQYGIKWTASVIEGDQPEDTDTIDLAVTDWIPNAGSHDMVAWSVMRQGTLLANGWAPHADLGKWTAEQMALAFYRTTIQPMSDNS